LEVLIAASIRHGRGTLLAPASEPDGAGSLVFGGGHVVLPLLNTSVVAPGWVTNEQFLAGYGAAPAVPGPLFTFAAYLGTVSGSTERSRRNDRTDDDLPAVLPSRRRRRPRAAPDRPSPPIAVVGLTALAGQLIGGS